MTDEQIGRHKGAVETLLHEKKELSRLLQIVNSQLQKHMGALEEAGIDTDRFIEEIEEQGKQQEGQRQENQQKRQRGQARQEKSRQRNKRQRRSGEKQADEPKEDADDLLEGENDFSDRDFNPNR